MFLPVLNFALRGFSRGLTKLDVVKDRVTSLKTRRCGFESHLVKVRTSGVTDSTPKYPDRLFPSGNFGAALNREGPHRRESFLKKGGER